MSDSKLLVSVSPHVHDKDSTQSIMLDVIIALMPAVVASVILFGFRALLVEVICVAVAVISEWGFEYICKRPITIFDCSAALTGLLLALNLPVEIPLWQAVFGSFVAIVLVKQLFGGIGQNFANPAITGRVIMLVAFTGTMASWTIPNFSDAISSATPLSIISEGSGGALPTYLQMFLGVRGGSMGETCCLALLLGCAWLLWRKVITWQIPVAFIGTVAVLSLVSGEDVAYQVMAGGLLLGAIFMATDYTTSPPTAAGKIIFGIGCGLITFLIRTFGSYPEGVSFSILLMNIVTPYINHWTQTKPFGGVQ